MSTTTPTRRDRRVASAVTAVLLLAGGGPLLAAAPAAAAGLSVSPSTTTAAQRGASTPLAGLSVAGGDPVSVTVSTDVGTLSIATTSGLTLAGGYSWTGQSAVTFSGSTADVNAGLASARLVVPGGTAVGTTATIGLAARPGGQDITYDPASGHYYQYVGTAGVTWDDARAQATGARYHGMAGYLVNITSSDENSLVTSKIPNALSVWIGGHDAGPSGTAARSWRWADGPEAGRSFSMCTPSTGSCDFRADGLDLSYRNWASSEPNNYQNTEWAAVTNWNSYNGLWNDLNGHNGANGYVIEFGGSVGDTPDLPSVSSPLTIGDLPAAPVAPTVTAPAPGASSPANTQATLTFGEPAANGTSITSYQWSADGTTWTTPAVWSSAAGTVTMTVEGLTPGATYAFRVRSVSAFGPSPASPAGTAVTLPSPTTTLTGTMPKAVVGSPLSTTFSADGFPAPTFAITAGTLPAGLTLSTGGQITGTPTTPGSYAFTVTATNLDGTSVSAARSGYVGTVPTAPAGTFAPVVGDPVILALTSTADPSPTFSVTGGTLPSWLTLDPTTGALIGTPTTPGQAYDLTVTADNGYGTRSTRLVGTVAAHTSVLTGALPVLVLGTAVDVTLTADGYPAPTYAVAAGALPDGLSLDATTGRITGTPSTGGVYLAEITARNLDHTVATLVLSGRVWTAPSTPSPLPWSTVTAGAPLLAVVTSTGDPAPTFAVTAGTLPTGLSLDATTGALTGTPTEAADWSFDLTATNVHGRSTRSVTVRVEPVLPTAPTALRVTGADHALTIEAIAPAFAGGLALTGYQVSLDGGGSWQPLTTSGSGTGVHGRVGGLLAGATYAVRVRAVNAVGAGPASAAVDGRPIAPAAGVLPAPTAVAGVSSVTVSWTRSSAEGVTGYTVTSFPSGTSCTTTSVDSTSCVLGAVAGQATTYSVVVHSAWGDSLASPASAPVAATAPQIPATAPTGDAALTTSEGVISQVARGQQITVLGTGFAPFSTAQIVIHSTPTVLATVVTDATGGFRVTVEVPANLAPGEHTLVAYGVDAQGVTHVLTMPVSNPTVRSTATSGLASTGADLSGTLAAVALLLGSGSMLLIARRRLRTRGR